MELENVIDIDVKLEEESPSFKIDLKEAGPKGDKGERGLSAYEVYLNAGGTLTEEEWLDSLKGKQGEQGPQGERGKAFEYSDFTEEQLQQLTGPQGPAGTDGSNGYTPVKGTDYWTEDDKKIIENDMKGYIDNQLGVIENAYY